MEEPIRVEGLAGFSRALRRLDDELPKALRVALNQAAGLVAEKTVQKVPRRSGRAAASIKAASTRTEARVRAGGSRAPYYPWLDFGGRVGRRKSVKRAFLKEGRYLFASYGELVQAGTIQGVMEKALSELVSSAGLEED